MSDHTNQKDQSNLQKIALDKTKHWIKFAEDLYKIKFPQPKVLFNIRGRVAGQYKFGRFGSKNIIRYNPVLLSENEETFIKRTVPHEVAHLVVRHQHGRKAKPHGWEWKKVMRDFGCDPTRCHSYDTANSSPVTRSRLKYTYKCSCKSFDVSDTQHQQILEGKEFRCRECNGLIEEVS